MNMYESLLEVVTESYAQNYYNCDRFLCQLQGSVRQLRQHYQNHRVTVDYSQPNIQAAYLLAYYPHYVQQMEHNLRLALQHQHFLRLLKQQNLVVSLIGSGPMPEALALAKYRHQLGYPTFLEAFAFDLNANGWQPACQVTRQLAERLTSNCKYQYGAQLFDLSQPGLVRKNLYQEIRYSQLIIMQNCLNEININNYSIFQENIRDLIGLMRRRSALMISDLGSYNQTKVLFENIKEVINEFEDIELVYDRSQYLNRINTRLTLPLVLEKNLLTRSSGLIPKSCVKQYSICLLKHGR